MKRFRSLLLLLVLAAAAPAWAQFTVVTGTIVDPNGTPYANGTITAALTTAGTPVFTATGQPYIAPTTPTGLSLTGQFTMRLGDVTQITPGGGTYKFTVSCGTGCVLPAGGKGPISFSISGITISGAAQDISAQLQAAAPVLSSGGGSGGGTFPTAGNATFSTPNVTITALTGFFNPAFVVGQTISVAGCTAGGDNSPPSFTIGGVAGSPGSVTAITYNDASGGAATGCIVSLIQGSATPPFNNVGAGTNPNALLISGSLAPTGGGTITANLSSGTAIAQTGVDINTSFQVTSLHLAAPLGVASGGTGITTAGLTGIPQLAAGVWSVNTTLPAGLIFTTPNIGVATGTSLSLTNPLTATNGGTGLNSSGSSGVPSVAAGVWSINTTPPAVTLANGTTASTQSPGDNSTKVATTQYVAQNAITVPGGITQGQNLVGGSSGGLSTADLISVKAFLPASGDVGAALASAQASAGGGNFQLGGMFGQVLGYANTLPSSLMASGSTKGGTLTFGQQSIYIDGPPGGSITSCSRTGQTVTIVISSLGTIAPPIPGSYIQILGLSSGNCSPFNNTSAQTTSPQLWQVTASTATSISFLSTASGTITSTGDAGTWQQVCFSDSFGSCMMTPGWIDPAKFGDWRGEGRGSPTVNSLNSSISNCTGAGTPFALCNFGPPVRTVGISSITFSCAAVPCQPSGSNPLNTATIVLTNGTGTSCGGAAGGCTLVQSTSGTASGSAGTVTVTTTSNHGLFPTTSWVTISGCATNGYNGYFQVATTPTPTTFTYTNATTGAGGGCEIDPHPASLFIGELFKWKGCTTGAPPAGCTTALYNGQTINEQQIPSSPIRSITNGNPPTSTTQTTIVIAVPPAAPWLSANNCTSLCGTGVLVTPVVAEGGAVAGGESSLCVKSSCYAVNQVAGFGNKFYNLGIDCQGVEGCVPLQNMYGNEGSGWDTLLLQSSAIACVDNHGQLQNGGPFIRLECLWPVATSCDYGTIGLSISEAPGFLTSSLTSYIRGTINFPSACAHQPTAGIVVDSANVHMESYYTSRTGGTSEFDGFLIGQNSNANNYACYNCQAGATPPGVGPSNSMFHFSNNSSTAQGPATGDYGVHNSQLNGNSTNLQIEDDVLNIFFPVATDANVEQYEADSNGYGSCVLNTTLILGQNICRKAKTAITAGQIVCNDTVNAGLVLTCPAAPAAGTVLGVAYNTVPASAIGTSVIIQTSGQVTGTVDTAGSCTLNAIVLVGPTTGGRITCGAFSAGTTMGTSITTGTITAGGTLTYNLTLR